MTFFRAEAGGDESNGAETAEIYWGGAKEREIRISQKVSVSEILETGPGVCSAPLLWDTQGTGDDRTSRLVLKCVLSNK